MVGAFTIVYFWLGLLTTKIQTREASYCTGRIRVRGNRVVSASACVYQTEPHVKTFIRALKIEGFTSEESKTNTTLDKLTTKNRNSSLIRNSQGFCRNDNKQLHRGFKKLGRRCFYSSVTGEQSKQRFVLFCDVVALCVHLVPKIPCLL